MANINTSRSILENMFVTGWGSTTSISYDNVKFDDSKVSEYVDLQFIVYKSENAAINTANDKLQRHYGVLSIGVYTKIGIGTGKAYGYADSIKAIMDNKRSGALFTEVGEVRRGGEDRTGWFDLIVDIPFVSDEA